MIEMIGFGPSFEALRKKNAKKIVVWYLSKNNSSNRKILGNDSNNGWGETVKSSPNITVL